MFIYIIIYVYMSVFISPPVLSALLFGARAYSPSDGATNTHSYTSPPLPLSYLPHSTPAPANYQLSKQITRCRIQAEGLAERFRTDKT